MDLSKIGRKENIELGLEMYSSESRSTYTLTNGGDADWYWDIDLFLLGASTQTPDGRMYLDATTTKRRVEFVVKAFAREIEKLRQNNLVTRIAFLENATGGPVGMISFASSLIAETGLEAVFVRPRRSVLVSAVKGRPFIPNERVVLLSDVATSGRSLLSAISILREAGADVSSVVVALDRESGAFDTLQQDGVQLNALWTATDRTSVRDAHRAA